MYGDVPWQKTDRQTYLRLHMANVNLSSRSLKRNNVSEIWNKTKECRWLAYVLPKFGVHCQILLNLVGWCKMDPRSPLDWFMVADGGGGLPDCAEIWYCMTLHDGFTELISLLKPRTTGCLKWQCSSNCHLLKQFKIFILYSDFWLKSYYALSSVKTNSVALARWALFAIWP